LAYISSLEERIRAYETNGVQANIQLQKLAKKLDLENKKLKKICVDALGLAEADIDRSDADLLIDEVKTRLLGTGSGVGTPPSSVSSSSVFSSSSGRGWNASRSSSFSGGIIDTSGSMGWSSSFRSSPFASGLYPSAPLSDVRSQKPPTPPPSKDDGPVSRDPAQELLLTIAPSANCGDGLNAEGKRFCGLLQLLAYESSSSPLGASDGNKTIPCRVSYELLKNLIDEQDSLALENAAFTLKDGVRISHDGNGCYIDAKVLTKVLEGLSTVDNHFNSASSSMLLDN